MNESKLSGIAAFTLSQCNGTSWRSLKQVIAQMRSRLSQRPRWCFTGLMTVWCPLSMENTPHHLLWGLASS